MNNAGGLNGMDCGSCYITLKTYFRTIVAALTSDNPPGLMGNQLCRLVKLEKEC